MSDKLLASDGEMIYSAKPRKQGRQMQFNIPKQLWDGKPLAKEYIIRAKPKEE
jgi:hypothetical protein